MINVPSFNDQENCVELTGASLSSWPSSHLEKWPKGHDGQDDVQLNISSTFVKQLERLFIPKNQDNSE